MYGKKNVMQQTRSEAAREGLVSNYDFTISQLPLHSVQGQVIQTHAKFFHKKRQAGATLPLNVCKQRGEGGSLAMGIHSMYLCAS